MAIGLTLRQFFIRIFIVGISKFCGGNETYPWLDDDLKRVEPLSVVVALYRRLEQLVDGIFIFFFFHQDFDFFFKNKCQQLRFLTPLTKWKKLGLLKHQTMVKVEATYRRLEEPGALYFDAVLP